MRPIPADALTDTVAIRPPAGGEYGGEHGEMYDIENVRVEHGTAYIGSPYVLDGTARAMMYIDATRSRAIGGGLAPLVGSLAGVDGIIYSVTAVRPYKGLDGRVHHWEVELS
jgi:hypothetical protein